MYLITPDPSVMSDAYNAFINFTDSKSGKNSMDSIPFGPIPKTATIESKTNRFINAMTKKNSVIAQK